MKIRAADRMNTEITNHKEGVDMKDSQREQIGQLLPEINEIKDIGLRERVIDAWLLALQESDWERIDSLPFIPGRAEFITTIQHCRGVARIGMAIARAILNGKDVAPGVTIDADVVIAGCLLHDVGKLLEYTPNSSGEKTPLGRYMIHHILGTYVAIKVGLPAEVVHCIESHREAVSFKRSYEAKIVNYSDILHAEAMVKVHPEVVIP